MRVTAKHNINYNGTWITGGDEFEISDKEFADLSEYVTAVKERAEGFASNVFPPDDGKSKRQKQKKTEE